MLWDVFISHAGEDKVDVARPLAEALERTGLRVWLDEAQVKLGDSLRAKIDDGLAQSRFGVVVLSPSFFSKDWPQRELNGLLARESGGEKTILPVWHEVTAKEITKYSPLLADRVAVSTESGIDAIVQQILRVAGQYLDRTTSSVAGRYSSDFEFPVDRIDRALQVIASLGQPGTWAHLAITRPYYPERGWMGTDSSAVIDILYDLMSPLVEFRRLSYGLKRSLSVFKPRARMLFGLLEAAVESLMSEQNIANSPPRVDYSPRVPDWRAKRSENPPRYWWQGISGERFDKAVPYFLESETQLLCTIQEFRSTYHRLYDSGDSKGQQDLGLLANALYGFSPRSRPVCWRLLVCWARVYQAALAKVEIELHDVDVKSVDQLFPPTLAVMQNRINDSELFEPFEVTIGATTRYLDTFVIPRLRSYLAAPIEQ